MTAPDLAVRGSWRAVLGPLTLARVAEGAARHAVGQRWYRDRGGSPPKGEIQDWLWLEGERGGDDEAVLLLLVGLTPHAGDTTLYTVPVRFVAGGPTDESEPVVVLRVATDDGVVSDGALVDATGSPGLALGLFELVRSGRPRSSEHGRLVPTALPGADAMLEGSGLEHELLAIEQSHSSIRYGRRLLLKLLRAIEEGDDAELEIGRFLAESDAPVPKLVAAIAYEALGGTRTLALLYEYVESEGTAFELFRREIAGLWQAASSTGQQAEPLLRRVDALALCTAELHRALARPSGDGAFGREPLPAEALVALVERARREGERVGRALVDVFPEDAAWLEARRPDIDAKLGRVLPLPADTARMRCHGDYHLGQVLFTGTDFRIVDFGGEPLRKVADRRAKDCPLRDVAGMLRSFDYALGAVERDLLASSAVLPGFAAFAAALRGAMEQRFVARYLDGVRGTGLVPEAAADVSRLLAFYLLEKCLYEVGYELSQRPAWLPVPLTALRRLLAE